MKTLKIALIGLGQRGSGLLKDNMLDMKDIEILAVCDEYQDRAQTAADQIQEAMGNTPLCTTDYQEALNVPGLEAVVIAVAWEAHVEVAVAAMQKGLYTGLEVGGAYSIDDCWKLVHTSEETGIPCMLLENCCYGQREMMCLNMAKAGVFGEIAHCDGSYSHDLREEVLGGEENRHYRLRNYIARNCDNYPTHELGPIAKLLNINRGNQMVSLVSIASKSVGLHAYAEKKLGADHPLAKTRFAQSDVITTLIRCAGGETIKLTLDTTLSRFYSRGLEVHGTQGFFQEANNSIYLDRDAESYGENAEWEWNAEHWNNVETRYAAEFDHPLWKKYLSDGVRAGHGGMDYLVLRAFFESAMEKKDVPIDVYDAAAWMCISTLSEQSIAAGGSPVAIPDFTCGKWIKQAAKSYVESYRLDEIPSID